MVNHEKFEKAKKKLWEKHQEWFGFEMDAWDKLRYEPNLLENELEQIIVQFKQSTVQDLSFDFPVIPVGILHSHMHEKPPQISIYKFLKDDVQYIAIDERFDTFFAGTSLYTLRQILLEAFNETNQGDRSKNIRKFINRFNRFNHKLLALENAGEVLSDLLTDEYMIPANRPQEGNKALMYYQLDLAISNWNRIHRLFIVGHEYAHLLLGHLNPNRIKPFMDSPDFPKSFEIPVGFLDSSDEEEYMADHLAFTNVLAIIENDDKLPNLEKNLSLIAMDFFFSMQELIDIIGKPSRDKRFASGHLLGKKRKERWKNYYLPKVNDRYQVNWISSHVNKFIDDAIRYYNNVITPEINAKL